ncbi:MAG TPA: MotA/TolQ/ExbB proton channel family protein, partial [Phenylobacterium sp.]|nr:MotA/TolQ/ExbB proton channel family protein [Phenylobacterium sp.]
MLDNKRKTPFIALIGAAALVMSAPAFAQDAAPADPAAAEATTTEAPAAEPAPAPEPEAAEEAAGGAHELTITQMFLDAQPVGKAVLIGLALASIFSWTLLIMKLIEFGGLERQTNRFLESFRSAKTINDVGRVAMSDDFEGNPLADMAAAAVQEVEVSRQAGLAITGEHRETTIGRAMAAVSGVQAQMAKRLSNGMQFLASVGSNGPFIGLFGTVYGIMYSFIGIANTNTTNLAVVAPGIAEALLATAMG